MNTGSNQAPVTRKAALSKKVLSLLHSMSIILFGATLGRFRGMEQQIVHVALVLVVLFFGLVWIILPKHISTLTAIVIACWYLMLVVGVAIGEQAVLLGWLSPLHLPKDWAVQ